ncbi:MAG: hypothetical protein Q9222_002210 [Ikaeria aurantiellina]
MESRKEDMAVHTLADKLAYREELFPGDDDGEPLIRRGRSNQWFGRVPRPTADASSELDSALEAAMAAHGSPSKPKPDFSFGYANDAFEKIHLSLIKALPEELQLYSDAPWFPYQIEEWKSKDRPFIEAQQQAQRDAAAACNVLYRFFKFAYPTQEPSASLTWVFSICVGMHGFDYRVHWRRVADDGEMSREGDRVAVARWYMEREVFDTRRAIMETLHWVRGTRLRAIPAALEVIGKRSSSLPAK